MLKMCAVNVVYVMTFLLKKIVFLHLMMLKIKLETLIKLILLILILMEKNAIGLKKIIHIVKDI